MANGIVVGGVPVPMPSHCGANCSYTVAFYGPWLQCNESSSNVTLVQYESLFSNATLISEEILFWSIYNGHWNSPPHAFVPVDQIDDNFMWSTDPVKSTFSTTTLTQLAAEANSLDFLATQNNLTCSPARATYTVHNSYENNVQAMNISVTDIQPLVDLYQTKSGVPGVSVDSVPGVFSSDGTEMGTVEVKWSHNATAWYRDLNLMNLIGVTTDAIVGSYIVDRVAYTKSPITYPIYLSSVGNITYDFGWEDSLATENNGIQVLGLGISNYFLGGLRCTNG